MYEIANAERPASYRKSLFQQIKPNLMFKIVIIGLFVLASVSVAAQVQTKVIGDSVLVQGNEGTAELILENSTKTVNGFLYNKGNGRTEFRQGLVKLGDSAIVIGRDTLDFSSFGSGYLWKLGGNAGTAPATHFLGTTDNTNFILRTNNLQRLSVFADGTFNIAPDDTSSKPRFRVYPNGNFTFGAKKDLTGNVFGPNGGVRFNAKYNILEVGTGNNFDTSLSVSCCASEVKSAIVINSDFINTFKGPIHGSLISGDSMTIDSTGGVFWSTLIGEAHYINGSVNKSVVSGHGINVNNGGYIMMSHVSGLANYFHKPTSYSYVNGSGNAPQDTAHYAFVSGANHKYGGVGQLLSGRTLVNRTPYGSVIGNGSVDFSTLPYTGLKGISRLDTIVNLDKYPLFAIGNSKYTDNASYKSNAMTVLYNGRTQINTTGYDSNLVEANVIPKAALDVVSKNSGILIPRLTSTERNNIAGGDLHNGLLLYNTDSTKFQFYNGSGWKTISDNGGGGSGNFGVQSLTDGSTVSWNVVNGINASVELAGIDRTVSISNPVAGQTYRLKIKQDGTGNRTITNWPSGTLWPSGTPPNLSTAANSIDMVTLYYDGTNYFGEFTPLFKTVSPVSIHAYDAKNDNQETVHTLSDVPAGSLLVLTTACVAALNNATVSSSPTLTWTKQADASAINSGDAEIYTAVFTAGGSITITSDWPDYYQSSVCYVVVNQENTLSGATATGTAQLAPEVNISTTRANSLIFNVTSDWNARNGSGRTYRGSPSPTERKYQYDVGEGTAYHYYYQATTIASYTTGLSIPNNQAAGTAVLEVRGK